MKKLILTGIGFVLLFGACEMPGAGQAASLVQEQVEDISDEIQDVVSDNEALTERLDNLQEQIGSASFDMPDMPEFDIDGLMETFDEDFNNLSARSDSLIDEMTLVIETQGLSIDSLRLEINDLEGEIASLRSTVTSLGSYNSDSGRTSSSTGAGSRGSSGTSSGGSTGGSTGGSSGGRI